MKKITLILLLIFSLCLHTACKRYENDVDIKDIHNNFVEGYITIKEENLETEHFEIRIDPNVYVPGYLLENIEVIYQTIETVSGLNFYNAHYNTGKIVVEVNKTDSTSESEFFNAFANSKNPIIHISSGDLLLGNSYAIVHELAHVLQYSNSQWSYNNIYTEGFAEYTSYKTIKYLETNNMYVAKTIESSSAPIVNTQISGDVYSQTIEYWIRNSNKTYDISLNGVYSVGMRFMNYLDNMFNDYKSWIFYYEQKHPYYIDPFIDQEVIINEQINAMIKTYGEEVFDGFYSWLMENEDYLYDNPFGDNTPTYDMTQMDYTYIYPYFTDKGNKTVMTRFYKFSYDNLYIVIDEARDYLKNYKGKDISDLKLKLSDKVPVKLYDFQNKEIKCKEDKEFSLVGVKYIKLVGKGTLGNKGKYGLQIVY